ncbi:MAG: VTT domain-containing protein [Saprospiraceae bacterium]|nr:VTT domain-containing protein [Saprospiraceae bacterium]
MQQLDNQFNSENTNPESSSKLWRIGLLITLVGGLILLARFTPVGEYLTIEKLRVLILDAGIWGVFIYIGIFIAAAFMGLPATAFLIFSIIVFGYWQGAGITYIAAFIGALATFYFSRLVGGKALSEIKNKRIQKIIQQAEDKPIRTLIILRTITQISPFVGYTLALTNIKSKHFIVGNIIANLIPIAYITLGVGLFEDQLQALFGVSIG